MNPLDALRCPIDPKRESPLLRERDQLVCDGCGVRYPVKNGIPVLIADEATLPAGCNSVASLPCQRRPGKARLG
jgi:uncharacterized protein YbaR (Trm112 family)